MKFLVKLKIPTHVENEKLKKDKLIKDMDRFIAATEPVSLYYMA